MENLDMNNKKEFKVGIIALIIVGIISFLSVTYAIWTGLFEGTKENVITTANLKMTLEGESGEINLTNAVPVSDSKGMSSDSYTFNIKNTGSIPVSYRIYLDDDNNAYVEDSCSDKKMSHSDIKYSIKKTGETAKLNLLSSEDGFLYETTIDANETDNYEMHLWISSDANNSVMRKHFHGKLRVEVSPTAS